MEKEILLDVQHLSIGFESYNANVEKVLFNAISDLNLTVHKGEIVAIVGFAAQMIATNNFNSVLKIDVDQRLLPIVGEFKPATWRKDIK